MFGDGVSVGHLWGGEHADSGFAWIAAGLSGVSGAIWHVISTHAIGLRLLDLHPLVAPPLQEELLVRAPTGATPIVHSPVERKHAAWVGGSILGSLAVMDQMWITKEEYDENGPLIVHRKCLF